MASRIAITANAEVDARLEAVGKATGLSKAHVLLAAFAQYRLDVPVGKVTPKVKGKPKEKTLGEGNHPKDLNEVIAYFRARGVPEPVEQKARIFRDHYNASGWMRGNTKVKNWGACLTSFQKRDPSWRPVPEEGNDKPSIEEFLDWVKEHRASWYEKLRDQKIEEVDEYYIEEYRRNTRF